MDDAEGLKKKDEALVVATLNLSKRLGDDSRKTVQRDIKLLASKSVERPQVSFADKPDNSHNPFVPKIQDKPNSLKPLSILPEQLENGNTSYSHPYEFEIERFEPSDRDLSPVEVTLPPDVQSTPLHLVQNKSDLCIMMSKLKQCTEIAVDLEHHNYRSFQGFTCLIQISTRTEDFIVDALKLRSELNVLNEVFTDPKVVKVLHGADFDVVWLQKDFGVYIVNLFDTFHASKTLGSAHHSLAHLLKLYCGVDADKQYQLSDWRIRPLPEEMIMYAQQDTHFLLYIYDRMKNDLLTKGNAAQNLLRAVISKSSAVCLKKYEKPFLAKDSHMNLIRKTSLVLNSRQLNALELLYNWRDKKAREEDESTAYILPNHMLLQLAQILPREIQGILACCQPTPPTVKQNLNELHAIFLKSRDLPLNVVKDKKRQSMPVLQSITSVEVHARHDVGHDPDHLTGLLEVVDVGMEEDVKTDKKPDIRPGSQLMIFFGKKVEPKYTGTVSELSFTTPYERFLKSHSNPVPDFEEDITMEADETNIKVEEEVCSRINTEVEERIRSIRQKEAAKMAEPAAIEPHTYEASDLSMFQESKESGKKRTRSQSKGRKRGKRGSGRSKGEERKESGNISYRYTVHNP